LLDPKTSIDLRNTSPIAGDFADPKDVSKMKIGNSSMNSAELCGSKLALCNASSLEQSER
jgi:hypothetical protein